MGPSDIKCDSTSPLKFDALGESMASFHSQRSSVKFEPRHDPGSRSGREAESDIRLSEYLNKKKFVNFEAFKQILASPPQAPSYRA